MGSLQKLLKNYTGLWGKIKGTNSGLIAKQRGFITPPVSTVYYKDLFLINAGMLKSSSVSSSLA